MTTNTVLEPKTNELTAVQYFQAKLAFEMTPWSLKALLEKTPESICLLDVRTPEMYATAHIPTAINIPLPELVAKLGKLPKNKVIVAYCSNLTCALAPKAALELAEKGSKVQELLGGIETWMEKGFPVDKKA
jgi:rhodanese-related sulfurtransferase